MYVLHLLYPSSVDGHCGGFHVWAVVAKQQRWSSMLEPGRRVKDFLKKESRLTAKSTRAGAVPTLLILNALHGERG